MAPPYCSSKALTPNLKMSHPQQPTTTESGYIMNGAIVRREEQANTTIAASLSHHCGTPGLIYITENIYI